MIMAVIGIDSHKDTLVGCLIDADERVVEHRDVPNSAHGHAELVTWAQTAGVERVGIEGSGNYGRPAAQALLAAGTTIDQLGTRIATEVSQSGTSLTDIYGIGPLTAAEIITETGDPGRYETKARFAMANGTAPIEASSGRVVRHRLNRGGNRQLNKALHIAAIAQIRRPDTEGHAYYQRCLDRGKTKREATRALKRRISDRIWTHFQHDLHTRIRPLP